MTAFYRFRALNADTLPALRERLQQLGRAAGVHGTVLLAEEGVNGTISGTPPAVESLLAALQAGAGLETLELKTSWSTVASFDRLKVRLKREIVTLGIEGLDPNQGAGINVPPEAWNALIDDPTTLVIDTRNAYEVAIGSFDRAIDPGTASFRDFPAWVEKELRPLVKERRPERLALFCTGGIRCEKATAYLRQQGFGGVHQLQGGILRYLEDIPEARSRWQGECYVFDRRVALNHRLEPGSHSQCHACGLPLGPKDRALESYVEGVSCRHCLSRFSDSDRRRFSERQRQMLIAMAEPSLQQWHPESYEAMGRFVSDLGAPVLALLDPQPGERVLDLGCGDGALTEQLVALGARVIGVDASAAMVAGARARGLEAQVLDGQELTFKAAFEAVFSNAALHWMLQPERVIAGVHRALVPGGRFVAEMGGHGNVAAIHGALERALAARGLRAPHDTFFPTPEHYGALLEAGGFGVESITLIPRPTPLPGDLGDWITTFAQGFLAPLPPEERPALVAEVVEALRPQLLGADGCWRADYVRLRFRAIRR